MHRFDDETELLDAIYRGVTDGAALDEALAKLRDRYGCDGGAFVLFDLQAPVCDLLLTSGSWGGDGLMARHRELAALDPAPRAFAMLPRGSASTTDRMFDAAYKKTCVFWNEFYRPSGFTETLGASLFADQARFALLGLHRGGERAPFSDDDIVDLERILPHLTRAFQLRRQFIGLEVRSQQFQQVVDGLDAGVVMLDTNGILAFANRAARTVLARGDGIALDKAGRLVIGHAAARNRLATLIAGVGRGDSGGTVAVARADAGSAYALLVAPAPTAGADWFASPFGTGQAMVLIHDPDRRPQDAAAILRSALGLTPGAARLLAALAADDDLKSFARSNAVTIHTARFHLRTALARTRTGSQSELVRLAVRLLRDVALRGD